MNSKNIETDEMNFLEKIKKLHLAAETGTRVREK